MFYYYWLMIPALLFGMWNTGVQHHLELLVDLARVGLHVLVRQLPVGRP